MNWIFLSVIIGGVISLLITPLFVNFKKEKKLEKRFASTAQKHILLRQEHQLWGG